MYNTDDSMKMLDCATPLNSDGMSKENFVRINLDLQQKAKCVKTGYTLVKAWKVTNVEFLNL